LIRECEICGEFHDDRWMMSFNSGRKTHWLCWSCFKQSQYEAGKNESRRATAIYKQMKQKGFDV